MGQESSFPLHIGVVTHAPTYGQETPKDVKRYRVRSASYDVVLFNPGERGVIGKCLVVRKDREEYLVKPQFRITFRPGEFKFWGAFTVDESGVATLEGVYLVVAAP
jgi:hypothetical protein